MLKRIVRHYDPDRPIISIHIPKCAGSSLKNTLSDWFPGRLFLHYFNEEAGQLPEKYSLGPGACVHGHFARSRGFGAEEYYPDIDQRITIIREPLEVAISNYFYIKRQAKIANLFRDGARRKYTAPTLETFIKKHTSYFSNFFPEFLDRDNYRDVLDDYFIFVGVVERMRETMDSLRALLQKPEIEIPHVNVSPRDDMLSKRAEAEFRERNAFAYKIFEYANERLDRFVAC